MQNSALETNFLGRLKMRGSVSNAVTDLAFYFIFSGVLLCGILFAYWISSRDADVRSRIFVGIFASFGAGVISRYLQHHLSTDVRPYFDSAVAFQLPHGMTIQPFNPWESFPSDHSTVFAGLVVVLFVIKSRIRYPVAVRIAIVESSRIFIGDHFPLDLMGGACLASTVVWIFQYPRSFVLANGVVLGSFALQYPSILYFLSFFMKCQPFSLT